MTPLHSAWIVDLGFVWTALPAIGNCRTLRQNEPLFYQGDRADWAYIVVSGRVRLSALSPDGRERQLMIIGSSGLVGERLGAVQTYTMSAYAANPSVVVKSISNNVLTETAYRHPQVIEQLLMLQERKFLLLLTHLQLQGSQSAMRRVCYHLLGMVESHGQSTPEGVLITLAFTKQEMASLCGLSRVSVTHAFSKLEKAHALGRKGRLVIIKNTPYLTDPAPVPAPSQVLAPMW